MSSKPELTVDQIAEDLSISNEMGGFWGYGLVDGQLFAEHYTDDGSIDHTININITFEERA